jgi:hypothetical protein
VFKFAVILLAFFFVGKTFARVFMYRPTHKRSAVARENETLRTIDLLSTLALIGGFFVLLNAVPMMMAFAVLAALVLYDLILRQICIHIEVTEFRKHSPKWTYRDASRHVRRRSLGPTSN